MKFKPGDLVMLVSSLGTLLSDHPPALILSGGIGYPSPPAEPSSIEPEEIYTILYAGELERRVSADWLNLVERAN